MERRIDTQRLATATATTAVGRALLPGKAGRQCIVSAATRILTRTAAREAGVQPPKRQEKGWKPNNVHTVRSGPCFQCVVIIMNITAKYSSEKRHKQHLQTVTCGPPATPLGRSGCGSPCTGTLSRRTGSQRSSHSTTSSTCCTKNGGFKKVDIVSLARGI